MKKLHNLRLKLFTLCFVILLSGFGLYRLYDKLTDDFRISNITYELFPDISWKLPPLTKEERKQLDAILTQKFNYFGKGAQCYAFVSEDQKYVLKFFKFKHLKPNWWIQSLPAIPPISEYKERLMQRKLKKLNDVFKGYALAYRKAREDSGLIYLHLEPTKDLHNTVTVIDKLGFERTIELDPIVFLIQKKGETFGDYLGKQIEKGELVQAESSISQILQMYISEYSQGIYDRDHKLMENTGFSEGKAFHLDAGKLIRDNEMREREFYKKDFLHVVWNIDQWIKIHYPDHYSQLSSYLSHEYLDYIGENFVPEKIDPSLFKKRKHLEQP